MRNFEPLSDNNYIAISKTKLTNRSINNEINFYVARRWGGRGGHHFTPFGVEFPKFFS